MAKKKKGVLLGKARFGDGEIYWLVQVEGEKRPQLYMEKDIPNLPIEISTKTIAKHRRRSRYNISDVAWPSPDSIAFDLVSGELCTDGLEDY